MEPLAMAAEALRSFEVALRAQTRCEDPRLFKLFKCMDYTLFAGGKRLRPMLCFASGSLFELPPGRLMSAACALEMIHTASLILDDLPYMDDGRLRRGKPTNHMVFGQDLAALASIGLLNRAYEVVLGDAGLTPATRAAVVERLARTVGVGGMVGGQFTDLEASREGEPDVSCDVEYTYCMKTSSLFEAAAEVPAIIAGARGDELAALGSFARHLGLAFQALDDIADSDRAGPVANLSTRADPLNVVDRLGEDESWRLLERHRDRALEAAGRFGARGVALVRLVQVALGRGWPVESGGTRRNGVA